ncbi:MAG: hypothetical protein PHW13_00115 [Methylococcales bacterium]|nr:hypothetical protein [Methylococcales bacterium]
MYQPLQDAEKYQPYHLSEWVFRLYGLVMCSVLPMLLAAPVAGAAALPTSAEILEMVGVPPAKIARLDRGEVIAHDILETGDRELAKIIAIYLTVPPEKVAGFMRDVDLITIDPEVTAYGAIPRNATLDDFKGLALSFRQGDEALELLDAEAGEQFNLSNAEISSFGLLKSQNPASSRKALVEQASRQYQKLLFQRWQAYRSTGLAGIAAYSREDGVTSPAEELNEAARNCKVLSAFFPQLYSSLLKYPAGLPAGTEEHFYWINRKIESRPTAVLGHRIFQMTKAGALVVERQFYVGHSYNSTHQIVGALPYRTGTLVFYAERTSTDQVAGLASGLRHDIGRKHLQEQMVERLERLGKTLEAPANSLTVRPPD